MNLFHKLWAICIFLFSASYTYAQTDTTNTQPGLKIGIGYINNSVYLGRTDTVRTPTITPNLTYIFGNGIYLSGALDYITNRKSGKLDGGNIELGYRFTSVENFEAGASFTKLFYNSGSTQVSSSVSSIINAYAAYSISNIVTPGIDLNYNINKTGVTGDFMLNPSLLHEFEIDGILGENDQLLVSPQVGLNAGSQNFYGGYLERKGRLTKRGTVVTSAAVTAATTAYNNALGDFKLLNYELTMPIRYKTGIFIATFTPTYAFAQNSLPQSTEAEKIITKNVELSSPYKPSVFYFEVNLAVKF
jgi:hypothetical protein